MTLVDVFNSGFVTEFSSLGASSYAFEGERHEFIFKIRDRNFHLFVISLSIPGAIVFRVRSKLFLITKQNEVDLLPIIKKNIARAMALVNEASLHGQFQLPHKKKLSFSWRKYNEAHSQSSDFAKLIQFCLVEWKGRDRQR